jgi:predicted nuclease of predicted toxin-antitoxin system
MIQYLIDVNLPYYFSLWNNENFVHQRNIDPKWKDNKIWDYAKKNNLTIITKDSDFSEKILFLQPPPRIIHIKFGNIKMKMFHKIVSGNWEEICKTSKYFKLVKVYIDRIEGIE